MDRYETVIVGSGMNSLVCAAILARAGQRVAVVERNEVAGGCIRTEELFPGYTHDVLSSWYPLFTGGAAYAELGDELHELGLQLENTTTPTGVALPDGRSLVLSTDADANRARFNELLAGDGDRFASMIETFFADDSAIAFGLLGSELRNRSTVKLLAQEWWRRRSAGTIEFGGESLESCRAWLEREFRSDALRALVAPWVLHAGLGPDDAMSGLMGRVIIAATSAGGLPVVVGGSNKIVDAFVKLIEKHGGSVFTGTEVERVEVTRGRATAVVAADGRRFEATKAVVCNVTPQQLYGRFLEPSAVPSAVAQSAADFRFGRSAMQIHYALTAAPQWDDPDLANTAMVHVTPGLDGVSRAVNEAERGLLPAEATIVVGQPTTIDPSRAPEGASILWIQLQELPTRIAGDAAGELDVPADGRWNDTIAEAYAERIHARLVHHIPNLDQIVLGRRVFSPLDLEGLNPNLVGGDPYSGACTVDQSLWWRPGAWSKNHNTPVKGLFHIGASTHPGPGLGGGSGFLVAQQLS